MIRDFVLLVQNMIHLKNMIHPRLSRDMRVKTNRGCNQRGKIFNVA